MLLSIGGAYSQSGDTTQAFDYAEQAADLFGTIGDLLSERQVHRNMAFGYESLSQYSEAETQLLRLVEIDEAIDHPELAKDKEWLEKIQAFLAESQP